MIKEREAIISKLERRAFRLRQDGSSDRWLKNASSSVREVAQSVCGPLLEQLVKAAKHADVDAPNLFREGAPLFDDSASGQIYAQCASGNAELVSQLREDIHSAELHRLTQSDADLGRMTVPSEYWYLDPKEVSSFASALGCVSIHPPPLRAGASGSQIRGRAGYSPRWLRQIAAGRPFLLVTQA